MDWINLTQDTGASTGLVWIRQWTFRFPKVPNVSLLTEELLASQVGLCCMKQFVTVIGMVCWYIPYCRNRP